MNEDLARQLDRPDFQDVYIKVLHFADIRMRRYFWRGKRASSLGANCELLVDGKGAADFVQDALTRLCDGSRKYNAERTLEENLKSTVDSIIWSHKKASDRKPILDVDPIRMEDGQEIELIQQAPDPATKEGEEVVKQEILRDEEAAFRIFRNSLDGDDELTALADAYAAEFFVTGEIAELTGIPAERVSELKRKLTLLATRFFGVKNFHDLNKKILGGE